MKHNASVPGGIYAVDIEGNLAYKYSVGTDVVVGCAVDNNGYIHFVTDNNSVYYIVKPNYDTHECELITKADLFTLIKTSGINVGTNTFTRTWLNVKIGNDGKLYVATSLGKSEGVVLCLSYQETTSPSTVSPWPMRGGDCHNTGRQK